MRYTDHLEVIFLTVLIYLAFSTKQSYFIKSWWKIDLQLIVFTKPFLKNGTRQNLHGRSSGARQGALVVGHPWGRPTNYTKIQDKLVLPLRAPDELQRCKTNLYFHWRHPTNCTIVWLCGCRAYQQQIVRVAWLSCLSTAGVGPIDCLLQTLVGKASWKQIV